MIQTVVKVILGATGLIVTGAPSFLQSPVATCIEVELVPPLFFKDHILKYMQIYKTCMKITMQCSQLILLNIKGWGRGDSESPERR